jgi:hypothetical protein
MVQQGLAFTVKSGTRASVVSTNANFCEVRFVEGDSKDRAAYMPFDMIQPDPPPKVAKSAEENRAYALWLAGEIRRQVETDRRTEEAERAGKERKMTEEQSQAQQVEAARKAAEERRRDEDVRRKAAETARKAEQAADAKLTLAKSLLRDGKADKARVRLEEIVKDYPESKAAEEARTLLKGLP